MGSTYFNKRIPMRTPTRRPRVRSKSFDTQEKAETWAKAQGFEHYRIHQLSKDKYCVKQA